MFIEQPNPFNSALNSLLTHSKHTQILMFAMKTSDCIFLVVGFVALAVAAPTKVKNDYIGMPSSVVRSLQEMIVENGGCKANVCFAIDGSESVGADNFQKEIQFLFDFASIVNFDEQKTGLAATQFGTANSAITRLTFSSERLNIALGNARYLNAQFTQIRGGLLFCFNELRNQKNDANKIVLLSDGEANLGGDPVPIADRFRTEVGEICAVGVGYNDITPLLDIVGGSRDKILTVDDYFELSDILGRLVVQVCDI